MSSTASRAFTGMLVIGDDHVPATVRFSDGSVTLLVARDEVGNWPASQVDFIAAESAYEIRAEGDSIRFLPDERDRFGAFIDDPTEERPVEPGSPPVASPAVSTSEPAPLLGEPDEEITDLFAAPGEDDSSDFTVDDLDEDEEAEPETELFLEEPDEYYAAGLVGPSADLPRPTFGAAAAPTDPGEAVAEEVEDTSQEQEVIPAPPDRLARPDTPGVPAEPEAGTPAEKSPVVEETGPAAEEPAPAAPADPGRSRADQEAGAVPEPPRDEATFQEAAPTDVPDEGGTATSRTMSGLLGRLRKQESTGADAVDDAAVEATDDDLPTPISDSDNLRQWALVAAGGVVLLAIIGVVAWGLMALLGGDDVETAVAEPPPTTVPDLTPTVPATSPTTVASPTTVPAENRAAATAFVTSWNDIARDYAYHLTIDADSLPISTAPAPTVHLTYGEEGVLELTMVPKGSGSDRDILVAMGLAVAWADPSLSPEGRAQLLGAMGIDVEAPQVSDMGGSLERNGVSYSTRVTEGVIRFRVSPGA